MSQKSWIDLLGVPQFNEEIDGNDIIREVGLHRFKILWSFDSYSQAKEAYDSWIKEYEGIKDKSWNYTKPIVGIDENGQPVTIDSWGEKK